MTVRNVLVLVVDGNPLTRNLVREALGSAGFTILEAEDGHEAFELAARSKPDLILQDLTLPEVDGVDLVARLRTLPALASVPIIAFSGFLSRLEYGRAANLGFTDFVQKPVDPGHLLELVQSHLPPPTADVAPIGQQRRILVIDDDPIQLKLAGHILADLGFEVTLAASGAEGLAVLRAGGIEAVLTDVLMPQPDGFRVCAEIRRDPALAHLPVILASSSFLEAADHDLARQVGANAMVERTPRLVEAVIALRLALSAPAPPTCVELERTDYTERMLRQLERQVALNHAFAVRAAIHASILGVIGGIAQALTRRHGIEDALPEVLISLLEASGVAQGALFVLHPAANGALALATSRGFPDAIAAELAPSGRHRELFDRVVTSLLPRGLAMDAGPSERALLTMLGGASGLMIPFVAERRCIGLLLLVSRSRDLTAPDWLPFARTMGVQIGQAFALSRAMTQIAASERRYRGIVETANEGVWVFDLAMNTTFLNARMAEMLGCAPVDVIGCSPTKFVDAAGVATLAHHVEEHRAGRPAQSEVRFVRADGSEVATMLGSSPVFDAAGDLAGSLAMVMDITGAKQAEGANLALQAQLVQSQKMEAVGLLAGGIAHDFNNLLSVILSYGEMLVDELAPGEPMRADVEEICKAGHRAASLTRQLLMFSLQQVVAPRVLDLDELLTDLDKMLQRILGADVALVWVRGDQLGRVNVDPGSLEQVIMNLVVNARDAMPTGGTLTIATSNVDLADARQLVGVAPGRYILLAVTDTGTGMDEATQARIFEPFFTTKPHGRGTGLGLSTVFGIVRQAGGSVKVASRPGHGTRIEIYLPRVDASLEVSPPPPPLATGLRGSETILLVEDDDQVRRVAGGILRRHGYTVFEASNAGEAMLIAEGAAEIELLLSDVVMPQMSGPELAKRLARGRPAMKILCMSGHTDDSIVRHGVLAGGLPFLQKPITSETLTRKVRDVLDAPVT